MAPAFVAKETVEPVAARTAFPVLFFVLLVLLLYCADMYLMANAGQFDPRIYSPYTSSNQLADFLPKSEGDLLMAQGRRTYNTYCVPCHQSNGGGLAGQFPPLAGSDWLNGEGPNRIIRIVLNGAAGPFVVNGANYNNSMVPWRDGLSNEDIAAVLTYVRNEWGNKGPAIKPSEVQSIREATKDKGGNWTMEELKAIPEK